MSFSYQYLKKIQDNKIQFNKINSNKSTLLAKRFKEEKGKNDLPIASLVVEELPSQQAGEGGSNYCALGWDLCQASGEQVDVLDRRIGFPDVTHRYGHLSIN